MSGLRGLVGAMSAMMLLAGAPASAQALENLEQLRTQALELVNQSRDEQGLPPLELGETLNETAQKHADDMLARDYYAHVGPDGTTPADRYVAAGGSRWRLIQENIALCAECRPPVGPDAIEELHRGWMRSPGHRKNILAKGIDRFGFGIAIHPQQGLYAVQTFAGPGIPDTWAGEGANGEAQPLAPEQQVSLGLELINQARREAGVTPLSASDTLTSTARSLLSEGKLKNFSPDGIADIAQAMPAEERNNWPALSMVSAACGGCGVEPSASILRSFIDRWLGHADRRDLLLDPSLRHFGLAMRANGEGRQLAVAVLGRSR